jgi:glycosyltransferase involved in cell wall biosynthesis
MINNNLTPKISVVIATKNVRFKLPKTIHSIVEQTYKNTEIIVIDAASTDGTVEYLEELKGVIYFWVSELDSGIFHAWNKGVRKARGEWVTFIGAGDFLDQYAFQNYVVFLNNNQGRAIDFLSSRGCLNIEGKQTRIVGGPWCWPGFVSRMNVIHPGALHNKSLFVECGEFDVSYKTCGDYEFLLRKREALQALYVSKITITILGGGISTKLPAILETLRLKNRLFPRRKFKNILNFVYAFVASRSRYLSF